MEARQMEPEQPDNAIPAHIAEMPLPQTETFTAPRKKPVGTILLVILAVIVAAAAGAGYAWLQTK